MSNKLFFVAIVGGCLAGGLLLQGCSQSSEPTGLQPAIAAVTPDSGNAGTQVQITGSNFEPGAAVRFGAWTSAGVVFVSSQQILAYAPDSIKRDSVYAVTVQNPSGKSATRAGAYRGVAPYLHDVNGASRPSGNAGSTVIFEGTAFGDLLGKGTVYFSDANGQPLAATVALPENWTDQFIVATVPNGAATGPVWISTPTGSTAHVTFTILQAATFSPSLIAWTQTQGLPDSSQGHGAVFVSIEGGAGAGKLVYMTGGADGVSRPRTTAAYAAVGPAGQLGAWTPVTPLPGPRAFHGTALATPFNAVVDTNVAGFIYVLGGISDSGVVTSTVFIGTVARDRSVGGWAAGTPLPVPLHSPGVTVFRSWLFVAGGATTGNTPLQDVYRAHINQDGTLGVWEVQPSLPYPRAYAPLVQFAGVLYSVGGDSGTVAPNVATLTSSRVKDIHYNQLDLRTVVLKSSTWTANANGLIKPVAKHSVVAAGGTLFVSGGVYEGSPSSSTEHQYASINPDGSVGSFSGATGSHTIAGAGGAGGVPFFNHAAITYIDANDVAHVVILGGNDINRPTHPVPDTYFY